MTRAELGARHAAAFRRHWRTHVDSGGQPSERYLDELAAIADEHRFGDVIGYRIEGRLYHPADVVIVSHGSSDPPPPETLPPTEMIPVGTEHAAAPAKAARRTTTRRKPA